LLPLIRMVVRGATGRRATIDIGGNDRPGIMCGQPMFAMNVHSISVADLTM
jgi:hypothetical protein